MASIRARIEILKSSLSLREELASIKEEKMPSIGVYGLLLDVHLPSTPLYNACSDTGVHFMSATRFSL